MFECSLVGEDAAAMVAVVEQGIDSRLEAITGSTFEWRRRYVDRLECRIAPQDMSVVLRRLVELGEDGHEEADALADCIVEVEYLSDGPTGGQDE